jgi:uncharacterized membrane protein YkvA (DUF1232 family)
MVTVAAVALALYLVAVLALLIAGRREHARALAGFVPDCAVLFARLARDPAVPAWRKAIVLAVAAYLASPIDLVPDFLPGVGQADDAVLVALALRSLGRAGGADAIARHWPGPPASLNVVMRLAGTGMRAPPQG